jgi:hypothetical protein
MARSTITTTSGDPSRVKSTVRGRAWLEGNNLVLQSYLHPHPRVFTLSIPGALSPSACARSTLPPSRPFQPQTRIKISKRGTIGGAEIKRVQVITDPVTSHTVQAARSLPFSSRPRQALSLSLSFPRTALPPPPLGRRLVTEEDQLKDHLQTMRPSFFYQPHAATCCGHGR